MNDYDAIFRILAGVGFAGWISVEDGMNGLDELARSVAFLKQKRMRFYASPRLRWDEPSSSRDERPHSPRDFVPGAVASSKQPHA